MAKTEKKTGMKEGIQIAKELIEHYWPHAGGISIVPPFNRYEVAAELVEFIQSHVGPREPAVRLS